MAKCTSCGRDIAGDAHSVKFPCPGCVKENIIRCENCRDSAIKYNCKCGFEGP